MKERQEKSAYRELTQDQLRHTLLEKRAELYHLRSEYKFARKLDKPHKLRALRREVARVLTELSARKLKEQTA